MVVKNRPLPQTVRDGRRTSRFSDFAVAIVVPGPPYYGAGFDGGGDGGLPREKRTRVTTEAAVQMPRMVIVFERISLATSSATMSRV